jgi:hypothetical protein
MFKKFITSMMVVAMFSVQASAATNEGLKAAFDELNYSLTVEWDQKDQAVYSSKMKAFTSQIRALQSKGMTDADLISFVQSEVKDKKVAKDLETAFNMISINKMSSEEASKYMVATMKKSYSAGASWNGDAVLYIGLGVLIVAAAIALAAGGYSGGGNGGGYCEDVYVCDTTCYNDYYYGYECYEDCYYACY